MAADQREGRLDDDRIHQYVESCGKPESEVMLMAQWVRDHPDDADGEQAKRKQRKRRKQATGEDPPLRSTVEVADQIAVDGSVYGWVDTTFTDSEGRRLRRSRRVFMNLTAPEADLTWRMQMAAPMGYTDDTDNRIDAFAEEADRAAEECAVLDAPELDGDFGAVEDGYHDSPLGPLPKDGWTIMFGLRGCGKTWITRMLAVRLAAAGVRVAWIDLEDGGQAGNRLAGTAWRGLPEGERAVVKENLKRITSPNVAFPAGLLKLKRVVQEHQADYLIIDSATAATQSELNTAASAASFYERMRTLGCRGGLAVAHTAKGNQNKGRDEGATTYGSTVWESVARLVVVVRGSDEDAWRAADGAAPDFLAPCDGERTPEDAPSPPFYLNAEVTKSNGLARPGSGAIVRVEMAKDWTRFGHVQITASGRRKITQAEQQKVDDAREAEWRAFIEAVLGEGAKHTAIIRTAAEQRGLGWGSQAITDQLAADVRNGKLKLQIQGQKKIYSLPLDTASNPV